MEMSDLFFESFAAILKGLKLSPDIAVQVTWDNIYDKIEWFDIVGKACDEFSEYRKEKGKIIQPYRFIFIRLQECWPCYYMWLSARIHLILKYTIQNHIFADGRLLEEARHYKYTGETLTDSDGTARIPFNLTGVIAAFGRQYITEKAYYERKIWNPEIIKERDGLCSIGCNV